MTEGRAGPAFPLVASNGSYEIGLLWKGTARPDSNESQAYALAKSQMARLDRDGTRDAYDKVLLQEYSELDAIEREPKPDTEGYYLPHHAVIRQKSSTTKVRVVFNASASKSGKQSLNDVVDPGPSLIPQLTSLLIRFRELPAAVQSDIRKAFFMIGVREDDRRYPEIPVARRRRSHDSMAFEKVALRCQLFTIYSQCCHRPPFAGSGEELYSGRIATTNTAKGELLCR